MKENIKETRFENGLVVLTDRMPGVRSATLGFFFRVGARHEPKNLHGISHFIEHTVFKGTARRSAFDIAIEQDRLGGNLDAFTSHEETGFAIKVIDDQLTHAFDLIADMLTGAKFDENDLKAEQKVIIEEMKMVEDSPEEYLSDIFNEAFFVDHALGRSIAGTPETVKNFDRELTRIYYEKVFNSSNLVIAAAGNVDHQQVVDLSKNTFRSSLASDPSSTSATPTFAAPIIVKQNKNLEQAHLIIATPFVSATDPRRYAAELLANIIGGGTSSRLWQKVREERGLAYNLGASSAMYQDCGVFSMFAATSPEQAGEVTELFVAELGAAVKVGISDAELDLAKAQSHASILISLEDSASRAAALAQSEMIHGRQIAVEETLTRVDAVTTQDCHDLAAEFFRTELIAFAALGDLTDLTIGRDDLTV